MTTDQLVSAQKLMGMNRRRKDLGKLSESILDEYYWNFDGWVMSGEGHETMQGERLMAKGWTRIPNSPRVTREYEHSNKWNAILRRPDGPSFFPVEQIVTYGWHRKPPVIFTCRQPLDDFDHPEHTQECWTRIDFPQLQGAMVFDAQCNICDRIHSSPRSQEHAELLIKQHMEVSHTEHLQNRALVTGLRDALAPVVSTGAGITPEQIAQIVAATVMAMQQQREANPVPAGVDRDHTEPHQGAPETSLSSEGIPDFNPEPVGVEDDEPQTRRKPRREANPE